MKRKNIVTTISILAELFAESYYALENDSCHYNWFLSDIERMAKILMIPRDVIIETLRELAKLKIIDLEDNIYIENFVLIQIDWLNIIYYMGINDNWLEGLNEIQNLEFKYEFFEPSTRKFIHDISCYFPESYTKIPSITFAICNIHIKEYESKGRNFYDNQICECLEILKNNDINITKEAIEHFVLEICWEK